MENLISIIAICTSLFSLYMTIKNEKILKQLGANKTQKNKEQIDPIEYLHSLEFNTFLDDSIIPLLGKYSNEEIVTKVFNKVHVHKQPVHAISSDKLREYITDVLSNYHNSYKEDITTFNNVFTDDGIYEVVDNRHIIEQVNSTNIDSVLNNFYR